MLTLDQKTTVTEQFDSLDMNHDGWVAPDDFVGLAKQAANRLHADPGQQQRLVTAMQQWGRSLLQQADTNGDGAVSREEYVATLEKRKADRANTFRENRPLVDVLWELMDSNHDDRISQDEFRRVYSAFGISDSLIEDAFRKIDTNRDGSLGREETTNYLAGFGDPADR